MKSNVRLLGLVVSFTLVLLATSSVLVVLGIFNEALHWDIFGPRLEALLQGVFGSCMALAGFGVAMSGMIALRESVRDFQQFVKARTNQAEMPDAPRRTYAARMLGIVAVMSALVGACALANHVVLTQRCRVFKRLAAEQVANFETRILGIVNTFASPPRDNVPHDLFDMVRTLDGLDFVNRTTLYIPDTAEPAAMWGYTAWRNVYSNADGFARFFVAKDFEKAMRAAVDGNSNALTGINDRNEFIWYKVLGKSGGDGKAVVRIDGNSHQSFREYRLGR